ncbi:MAG: ubiquinone biosynthesis accessory factor UbiJ [Gammaproteobacteria bacterium]
MVQTTPQARKSLPWLAPLNFAIERFIAADELLAQRVSELSGKTILFHIEGVDIQIYASFRENHVFLSRTMPIEVEKVDVSLRGKPKDFIALAKNQRSGQSLSAGQVEIQGEIHTAQRVQDLFEDIDIDFEQMLARATNDAFAYRVGSLARRGLSEIRKGLRSFEQDLGEFVQYEKRLTPSRDELVEFSQGVDDVALEVERLESKIRQLGKQRITRPQ